MSCSAIKHATNSILPITLWALSPEIDGVCHMDAIAVSENLEAGILGIQFKDATHLKI